MATAEEAVSRLQIESTESGIDETTDSLNKLAEAYGGVAVASATTDKTSSSLDKTFAGLEQRYSAGVKAQNDYQRVQNQVNAAVAQNPALQDRANVVLAAAKQRYEDATNSQSLFQKSLTGVQSQMVALSAGLGPVGTALAAIGPVGLAVGAAIGVAAAGFKLLADQANEAGQWAQTLQQASNIIGLNTTQLQALNEAAAGVGVAANDNVSAFEKFSVSLGQLKEGSGSLYTELLKVNPALVSQLSVTKDSATAWNLLAQAYASASTQQQALITRAAFGRGGAAEGQVLQATANAGGLSGLTSNNQSDAISQQQIQLWAQLTTQINSATEAASHNFQSIFTTQILTAEKNFADNMLDLSRYAKDFQLSEDWKAFIGVMSGPTATTIFSALAHVAFPIAAPIAGAVSSLFSPSAPAAPRTPAQSALPPAPNFDATFGALDKSNAATATASLGVQASQAAAAVTFLGSAATATDKYNASLAKLNLQASNNKTLTDLQGRALAGINLDKLTSEQNSYVSALGEFATTQDKATQADLNFQKAMLQNPRLTDAQRVAVVNLTVANDEWTRASNQAQIGVFNLGAATKAAGDQFAAQQAPGGMLDHATPDQLAAAYQAYTNKVKALGDTAKVAGSAFPQLAQLSVDAANVNKQFDTFATTSLNDFSDALVAIGTNASTAGAAFTNFGLQVLAALEKMIIQLTIIKPLAASLESAFGGSGSFLSALGLGGSSPGLTSVGGAPLSLGGITLGNAAGPVPFTAAGGGTFGPGWGIVGEQGPELIKVHSGGVTVIPNQTSKPYLPGFASGGSMNSSGNVTRLPGGQDNSPTMVFNYAPSIDARGQDPSVVARIATVQAQDRRDFQKNVIAVMSQYKANTPGSR